MADKKISQLTGASTPVAGTEVLPIVQSAATVKVSIDNLTKGRVVNALSFDTDVAAAAVTLSGTTLAADGTDANIDINITPKGAGEVNLPKVDIDAGAIDGTTVGGSTAAAGTFTTLTGNLIATARGALAVADQTWTTVLALSDRGVYMIFAYIQDYDATSWAAYGELLYTGSAVTALINYTSTGVQIRQDSGNIQVYHNGGAGITIQYRILKLG